MGKAGIRPRFDRFPNIVITPLKKILSTWTGFLLTVHRQTGTLVCRYEGILCYKSKRRRR